MFSRTTGILVYIGALIAIIALYTYIRILWNENNIIVRNGEIYMAKGQTLEQSFEKLEEILERLGQPDISLDESLKVYNEGIKLVRNCSQQLDKVEKQIIILNDGEGGQDEL